MNFLRSPKQKLMLAAGLLLALALLAPSTRQSAPSMARWALAAAAMGGLAWWLARKRQGAEAGFTLAPKLEVLSRAGLSAKCGLALVEADGRKYLIVHGDGFARIRETRPEHNRPWSAAPEVVRPSPRRPSRKLSLS